MPLWALAVVLLLGSAAHAQLRWRPIWYRTAFGQHAATCYDWARQELVRFGGKMWLDGPRLNATWVRRSSGWTVLETATKPLTRVYHSMAFDPVRQTVLMFGGLTDNETILDDTWEWNGYDWRRLSPVSRPSPRFAAAMTFDPVRQEIVLFGGFEDTGILGAGLVSDETWVWDGSDWRRRQPLHVPHARGWAGMAYDASSGHVAMVGGNIGLSASDRMRSGSGTAATGACSRSCPAVPSRMCSARA